MTRFRLAAAFVLACIVAVLAAFLFVGNPVLGVKIAITAAAGALAFPVFGAVSITDDFVKYLVKAGLLDAAGGYRGQNITAKTADYTILAASDPSSTIFTNRGAAGAVIFTLPTPAPALKGVYYDFIGVAAQNFTVNAGAGNGVSLNNAACASVACSTAGQKIGAHIRASCDGTSWLLIGDTVGVTYTVA